MEPALFCVMRALSVQVEPCVRCRSTEEMVLVSTVLSSVWPMPVNFTVAPLEPAEPQLFASLPEARMRSAADESKTSVVLLSTTSAGVFVK